MSTEERIALVNYFMRLRDSWLDQEAKFKNTCDYRAVFCYGYAAQMIALGYATSGKYDPIEGWDCVTAWEKHR